MEATNLLAKEKSKYGFDIAAKMLGLEKTLKPSKFTFGMLFTNKQDKF